MKVKPLVATMYSFEVPTNDTIRACNHSLVQELKEDYMFLYKVGCNCYLLLFVHSDYTHIDTSCCDCYDTRKIYI